MWKDFKEIQTHLYIYRIYFFHSFHYILFTLYSLIYIFANNISFNKMMRKLLVEELGRKSRDEYIHSTKFPITIVLDNIRSIYNIGSVFRTADALFVEKIILCGITAQPPSDEIHKTALGAELCVSWEYYKNTIDAIHKLKNDNYQIWSVEQVENSTHLQHFHYNGEKIALVFGHEVKGVQQDIVNISDGAIEIPQFGTKHSLNVSVSAGIVLWDIIKNIILH